MRFWRYVLMGVAILVLGLWFVRLVLPSQVDDVSPLMGCSEDVLDLADVYFVVPKFDGVEIGGVWCDKMKNLASSSGWGLGVGGWENRLAMHGVYHNFGEFGTYRDRAYFREGVEVFEECFGFAPARFKPGQLEWIRYNDWIQDEVEVDLIWNQIFHKVYHCGDSGVFPNWLIRVF
ncbi:hypothetical protein HN903_03555 [archaeon]|nr:hypothetical protein [archaeon]MBT7128806.1 hypothetical protein [archaeon]